MTPQDIIKKASINFDEVLDAAETAAGQIFMKGLIQLSRKYPRRKITASVGMGSGSINIEKFPRLVSGVMYDYRITGFTKYDDHVPGAEFMAEILEFEDMFGPVYRNRPIIPDIHAVLLNGECLENLWGKID